MKVKTAGVASTLGAIILCLPATAFVPSTRLGSVSVCQKCVTARSGRGLPLKSVQLPTRSDGTLMEPLTLSEAAQAVEGPAPGEVAVVERKAKGPPPKIVIENDMLEGTWQQRAIVTTGFALSTVTLIDAMSRLSLDNPVTLAQTAATLVFSLLFSDFFSGVFHWSVDNYGDGRTPIMGDVIAAFQGHHESPWTITYRPFENNVHKISAVTIPAILAILLTQQAPLLAIFGVLFFNLQVLSQEFHKYSHMTKPPAWASALQEVGLIISRRNHGQHHSSPFDGNYCILTGMCNGLLDDSGFFRRLETIVYRLTGAEPNCWKLGPEVKQAALQRYQ